MKHDHIPPRIILVAGVPRSGSTWLFNAARHLLEQDAGELHSAWIEDYHADDPAPIHLVKAHRPEQVPFDPDLVLTTRRPTEACLASLIRMGWLANTPEKIRAAWANHQRLYDYWVNQSNLEVSYEQIINAPQAALGNLAQALGLVVPPSCNLSEIATELAAMKAPKSGRYDPQTLLHPNHRKPVGDTAATPADILRIIAQ